MINEVIGYTAGILMSITMVPQIVKALKTKSVKDLSIIMIIILITGSFLWAVYGFLIKSMPVILMDIIAVVINSVLLIIKINYRKK